MHSKQRAPTTSYIRAVVSDCDCQNATCSPQQGLLSTRNISLDG